MIKMAKTSGGKMIFIFTSAHRRNAPKMTIPMIDHAAMPTLRRRSPGGREGLSGVT